MKLKVALVHLSMIAILIGFQNCGPGFESTGEINELSSTIESAPTTPSPPEPIKETPPPETETKPIVVTPPAEQLIKITSFDVIDKKESSVVIEWNLSKGGNGQVEYGENSMALDQSTSKELSFEGTFHRQIISNLKSGTPYYFKIYSYDERGQLAEFNVTKFETLKKEVTRPPSEKETTEKPPQNNSDSLLSTIPYQGRIAHPLNSQPATPRLPNIGEFIDMPGTNGKVEFTRITEAQTDTSLVHSYAKRLAIDPFNKYLILNSHLYSLSTLKPFKRSPIGYEKVPSLTQQDLFFGISGKRLVSWNVSTDEQTIIWSAPSGASDVTIGRWEGQQSLDDKYIVICFKQNGQNQVASIDIENKKLLGQASFDSNFNWADVSPSGKYVIVGTNNSRILRYDISMKNKTTLNTRHFGNGHADLMYDKLGNEVILQEGNFSNGDYSYVTLDGNQKFEMDLIDTSTQRGVQYPNASSHISGQISKVPGKVFISLQIKSGMYAMFTADVNPNESKTQLLGYTFTKSSNYYSEAKATISSDGNTIVWTSDWMKGGNSFYTFLARIKK